jgi:hypothetical protein
VANFILKTTYNITVSANPVAGGNVSGGGNVEEGASVTVIASANPEYNFVNWTENGSEVTTNTIYNFTATANRTLVANFILKTYTITSSASAGGIIKPEATTIVNHGGSQSYEIEADKTNGYHIAQVLIDGTNNPEAVTTGEYTFQNVTSDHTIAASFALNTYTVSVSSNNNLWGTATIETEGTTFEHGDNVTIKATPTEFGDFVNWTSGESLFTTNAEHTFQVTADTTLTANFTEHEGIGTPKSGNFTIYPNPVKNELTIIRPSTDKARIEIYTVNGVEILKSETTQAKSLINLSNFPTGVYTIKLIDKQTVATTKFVKE